VDNKINNLVIVGRFPFSDRRLEGMLQRIANVDAMLAESPRTYLDLYLFRHFRTNGLVNVGIKTNVYTASFLHFWAILKVLQRARVVYIHSIYFYLLVILPLIFTNKRVQLFLDIHGTVPEEEGYAGKRLLSFVMGWVERAAFSRAAMVICVTRAMEKFYREKYPKTSAQFLYLPIFTTQVCIPADLAGVDKLRSSLGISIDSNIYLYSGGLQNWQNISMMLQASKLLLQSRKNWCIFLTNEPESLAREVKSNFGLIPERMIIAHAKPNELCNYYEMADFGFILRDDHILNQVANPTKLVEYLYFGIRPIVLSEKIGDFINLGYEFVRINDLMKMPVWEGKSEINRQISLQLLKEVKLANLSDHISK
jgi:hypothetical protein